MVSGRISILLSTFNSEAFLNAQIDSILSQTVTDWILYIRDDGSADNTLSLIDDYCRRYNKIIFLSDSLQNIGAKNSFTKLLSVVDSDYYMFCDHDDVWLSFKIEKTLEKMQEIESLYPENPLLVFTDLKVVDAELNIISDSMWNFQKTNPHHAKDIYYLSISNPVTACTVMINQRAKEISLPMPQASLMHDLWIALNVSHYGYIDFVDEPTILYRQHNENVIGAKKTNMKFYFSRFAHLATALKDNIKMIRMINSLHFRINHFKRILLKINLVSDKLFNV